MSNSRHHSDQLRFAALVVGVVQLVSITWVPMVHPSIHPDLALSTPLSALDVQTSGEETLVLGETMCVACTVSPNAMLSPYRVLPGTECERKQSPIWHFTKWYPLHSFVPTHPARAPPSF